MKPPIRINSANALSNNKQLVSPTYANQIYKPPISQNTSNTTEKKNELSKEQFDHFMQKKISTISTSMINSNRDMNNQENNQQNPEFPDGEQYNEESRQDYPKYFEQLPRLASASAKSSGNLKVNQFFNNGNSVPGNQNPAGANNITNIPQNSSQSTKNLSQRAVQSAFPRNNSNNTPNYTQSQQVLSNRNGAQIPANYNINNNNYGSIPQHPPQRVQSSGVQSSSSTNNNINNFNKQNNLRINPNAHEFTSSSNMKLHFNYGPNNTFSQRNFPPDQEQYNSQFENNNLNQQHMMSVSSNNNNHHHSSSGMGQYFPNSVKNRVPPQSAKPVFHNNPSGVGNAPVENPSTLGGPSVQFGSNRPKTGITSKNSSMMGPPGAQKLASPLIIDFQQIDDDQEDIRDKLWDKVYNLKNCINQNKETNNNLKAQIWNLEKENRKMKKQIENWDLEKGAMFNSDNQPYVDSATTEQVYKDQNFSAITMKSENIQLRQEIKNKQKDIKKNEELIQMYQREEASIGDTLNEAFQETYSLANYYKDSLRQLDEAKQGAQQVSGQYRGGNYGQIKVLSDQDQLAIDTELEQRKELALENIRTINDQNKVLEFEIQVQQNAFQKTELQLINVQQKLQAQLQERQELAIELDNHQPTEQEMMEFNNNVSQAQKKNLQNKLSLKQQGFEELLDEKDKELEKQKKGIEEINYLIQQITRNSIIEKQDLQKEIDDIQQQIKQLEQQYIHAHSRVIKYQQSQNQNSGQNVSGNITMYNSEIQDPVLHIVPEYLVQC